jgi:hypothetical protein
MSKTVVKCEGCGCPLAVGHRFCSTTCEVAQAVASIAGDTAEEMGRAYKQAFLTLTPEGKRQPDPDVRMQLDEGLRKALETITFRPARKAKGERKPKGEFPPIAMRTLDFLVAHGAEHGYTVGLSVNEITQGMGEKYTGTVWHAVKRLVSARRVRPMPSDPKRFTLFPSATPAAV